MARQSRAWRDWERTVADALGGRRIVRLDFFESAPDILVGDLGLIVEAKYRAKQPFRHHALLEVARRKYAEPGEIVALATKNGGEAGGCVTLLLDDFVGIVNRLRRAERGSAA